MYTSIKNKLHIRNVKRINKIYYLKIYQWIPILTKRIEKQQSATFSTCSIKYNVESLKEFKRNIMYNALDTELFEKIEQILNLKRTAKHRQRRIEKLLNVYLISKEEINIKLNPLWSNKLFNIFYKEYESFNMYWKISIASLKYNLFDPWDLTEIFNTKLIFFVTIVKYLALSDNKENTIELKKATVVATVVQELFKLLGPIFELYYFMYEYGPLLKEQEINKKHIKIKKQFKEITSERWETELLNLLKKKDNNTTISSKEYTDKKKEFERGYYNFTTDISAFLTQIVEHALMDLKESKVFLKTKYSNKGKTYDYIEVFDVTMFSQLRTMTYLGSQIAMIIEPLDWNEKGEEGGFLLNKLSRTTSLTSCLLRGKSQIKYSKYTIDSINRLQKKKYKINRVNLEYAQGKVFKEEYGIKEVEEIYETYVEKASLYMELKLYFKEKSEDFTTEWLYYKTEMSSILSSKKYRVSNKEDRSKLIEDLRIKYGITEEFLYKLNKYRELKSKLFKDMNVTNSHKYIIKFSELYKGESLYLVTNLDFRTRFFPVGRGLHRAAGLYKYILYDPCDCYVHNNESIKWLKQYISMTIFKYKYGYTTNKLIEDIDKYFKIIDVDVDVEISIKELKCYLITGESDSPLVRKIAESGSNYLLSISILDYLESLLNSNHLSKLSLDIDQCSSGPMIYSLLSRDRYMGFLTNALPKSKVREDLYCNFLEHLEKAINITAKTVEEKDIQNNFTNWFDRSFSKEIIMPTFYNMGAKGKYNVIYKLLQDKVTLELDKKVQYVLKMINKVLVTNYSNTISYQQNLVAICKEFKIKESINIRTLDGSLITYSYLNPKVRYGRIYRQNKPLKYRIYSQIGLQDKDKQYSYNHYWSFPPNYIHSLDGSLCRIVCNLYSLIHNTELEPLHDSFRVPLNNVNKLQTVIKYVYLYFFFNTYFNKKRIGISNIGNIEKDSSNFEKTKKLLPILPESFDFNILKYTFFDQLSTTIDREEKIRSLIQNIVIGEDFTDEESESFYQSEFMYYF